MTGDRDPLAEALGQRILNTFAWYAPTTPCPSYSQTVPGWTTSETGIEETLRLFASIEKRLTAIEAALQNRSDSNG